MTQDEARAVAVAYRTVTSDALIHRGPALFWGYVLKHLALAGQCFIMDDVESNAARAVFEFDPETNQTFTLVLTRPIVFERGIYADMPSAGATNRLTVFWEPIAD